MMNQANLPAHVVSLRAQCAGRGYEGFTNLETFEVYAALCFTSKFQTLVNRHCRITEGGGIHAPLLQELAEKTIGIHRLGLSEVDDPTFSSVDWHDIAAQWEVDASSGFVAPESFKVCVPDEADLKFQMRFDIDYPYCDVDVVYAEAPGTRYQQDTTVASQHTPTSDSVQALIDSIGDDAVLKELGLEVCGDYGLMMGTSHVEFTVPLARYPRAEDRQALFAEVSGLIERRARKLLKYYRPKDVVKANRVVVTSH
jgi:hypothetical protein